MKYRAAYVFGNQVLFTVEFEVEKDISDEALNAILAEQAAIMKGEREGIITKREI